MLLKEKTKDENANEMWVRAGAVINHAVYGEGIVTDMIANFPQYPEKLTELPYLISLPKEVQIDINGKTLHHDGFGDGYIVSFIVVFQKGIIRLLYPTDFVKDPLIKII